MVKLVEREDKVTTKEYVLLRGKHYGRDDQGREVRYEPGDSVPLTQDQYLAFQDKFEGVEVTDKKLEEYAAIMHRRAAQIAAKNTSVKLPSTEEGKEVGYVGGDAAFTAQPGANAAPVVMKDEIEHRKADAGGPVEPKPEIPDGGTNQKTTTVKTTEVQGATSGSGGSVSGASNPSGSGSGGAKK